MNTIRRLERTIRKFELLRGGETVVVGVSGGPDSVFLFHALLLLSKSMDLKLVTAHFNHRLRREADADEKFVRLLSERNGIPFYSAAEEIGKAVKGTGRSLEEFARERRHQFFSSVREKTAASRIALGHTRDDRIETFLMRVFSGTGLSGLNAVRPVSGHVIHPMVELEKKEILAWLKKRRIRFRIDKTNADTSLARNLIRRRLLPLVRSGYKECGSNITDLMDIIAAEDEYMAGQAAAFLEKNGRSFGIAEFRDLPLALQRRALHSLLKKPDFHTIEHLRAGLMSDRKANEILLERPGQNLFKKSGRLIEAGSAVSGGADRFEYRLEKTGDLVPLPELGLVLRSLAVPPDTTDLKDRSSLIFDLDKLVFPLVIRSRKTADRISLLGTNGSKKLKDIFIDLKIPSWERDRVPVVAADGRVCGVFTNFAKPERCNYISSIYSVSPATRRAIRLTLGE